MAWPKGKSKDKTGGRKTGTPNKRTQELIEILEEEDFDPARKLIITYRKAMKQYLRYDRAIDRIMNGDPRHRDRLRGHDLHDQAPTYLRLAQDAAKELMQYRHPKRKAIELSGAVGGPLDAYLRMTPEERADRRAELQTKLKKAA